MPENKINQSIKENLEHAFLKIAQHPADQILENQHPKLQLELLAQGFNTFTSMELRKIREYSEENLLISNLESNLALPSEMHPKKSLNEIQKVEETKELKGTISNDQRNSKVSLKELSTNTESDQAVLTSEVSNPRNIQELIPVSHINDASDIWRG